MGTGVNPEVLIIGCGFLGEAAADLFSAQGESVLGLVRTVESRSKLSGRAFETALCDVTSDTSVAALSPRLEGVPLVLYAVSSGGGTAADYAAIYRDGLRRVLFAWKPQRLIFVSSTSVYGQNDGSWITEESPTLPERDTARVLLEAEELALHYGGIVARLTGIYGPGRSMLLRKFLSGEAVIEEGGRRWLNQIHRDDGASALLRLAAPSVPAGIYNVTDDTPVSQRELYGWMADFLQRPLPPEGASSEFRKRGITSKRISNEKLRSLGWTPDYPSYREALPELVAAL
jgi:nucleoside-diphosphate-sugar epimerase